MIQIPIARKTVSAYVSEGKFDCERAQLLSLTRWTVKLQYFDSTTRELRTGSALLDTGAPLSVVPHQIAQQCIWTNLGSRITPREGYGVPDDAKWDGIACSIGRFHPFVVDPSDQRIGSKVCTVFAKFASAAHPAAQAIRDRRILLGANFLLENRAQLVVNDASIPHDYLLLPA